ncbi:PAS domain-containing protein [Cellulophaga sp. E16_2]|uniref:histidine kinase n=1 Tax=Cellulophaga algicola (strain DSM 14237 / IC166 / ACAM 630) TaxID=688270 RepID=E6X6J1_CELAD|nr:MULTISPECIES: PAS domain-containing protein [Cellulophaga]ADV48497.1 PAS/PAC sensor signal transduction histidine kinase [Cellulophaga algicola DSM 14237]MBO0590915.1 PAS domain-containing protein [Cellulophaga sp. E16_2]
MGSFFSQIKVNESLIKDAPISIATLDHNCNFLSFSKKFLIEHKISTNTITDAYFFDVLPDFPIAFKEVLDRCLLGNPCQNEGHKYILDNGKNIWLKWKINPWTKEDGSVGGLVVALDNITETKNIDELIKEAQEVSRTGGWQLNLLTYKAQWTKMVNIIHEMPLDYVPETFDECFVHFKEGEDRELILKATHEAIENGTPWDEEVIMITGTGKELWIRTKGRAEFVDGKCVRIYGICQDIDTAMRSQLAYRASAEKLKSAISASNVGTWEYDLNNGYTLWDDTNFELHHIDKDNYTGSLYRNWKKSLHPDDMLRVHQEVVAYYNGQGLGIVEYRVLLPNHKIRNIKASVTILTGPKNNKYRALGICQDITNEKNAAQKLKKLVEITGQQNNSLTNFAHMVSHDLRSHATNLSVLTSLIEDEKDPEERKQILAMLKSATNSLNSTVYNLSEVVQSNDANIQTKLAQINILKAITTVQNNIGTLFQDKKGMCVIDVNPDHFVHVVPAYLDSVFLNLFTNSLKYCAPNRSPIIKICTKLTNKNIQLTFEDNGKGIDMVKFGKNIFGMNKTFHRNKDARGVGLYITKNQIEAMGGTISVTSEVNIGTKFTINLKTI